MQNTWVQSPTASLLNLQTIKHNPNYHTMSYRTALNTRLDNAGQDKSVHTGILDRKSSLASTSVSSGKKVVVKVKKQRANSHSIFNFDTMTTSQSKKPEKHNLPPERRQLIVEKYIKQAQNPQPAKATLDLLWHQTLHDHIGQKEPMLGHHSPPDSPGLNRTPPDLAEIPMLVSRSHTVKGINLLRDFHREDNTPPKRDAETPTLRNRLDSLEDFPRKKMSMDFAPRLSHSQKKEQQSQQQHVKKLEEFNHCIRDFYKTANYMRKAREEINTEQKNLHEFILAFTKEIEYVERTPTKDANRERLRMFQNLIESRLNEIFSKQELLVDQIRKIKAGSVSSMGRSSLEIEDPPVQPEILSVKNDFDRNTLNVTITPVNFNSRKGSVSDLINKTEVIKEDVLRLQEERRDFLDKSLRLYSSRHRKTVSSIFGKSMQEIPKTNTNTNSNTNVNSTLRGTHESGDNTGYQEIMHQLATLPRMSTISNTPLNPEDNRKLGKSLWMPTSPDSLIIHRGGGRLASPTYFATEASQDLQADKYSRGISQEHFKFPNTTSGEDIVPEQESQEECEYRSAHKDLQLFFTSALDKLESQFLRNVKDFKVFLKELDTFPKRREAFHNSKMIHIQSSACVDYLNDTCLGLLRSYKIKGKAYQDVTKEQLQIFENTLQTNILKISSLKNLIASSIDTLFSIQDFKKAANPLDLRDKDLRKSYESKLEEMKVKLAADREAIVFIAQQIARSLPIYKDSNETILVDFLAVLCTRANNLLRGAHLVLKLPQIDEDTNKKIEQAFEAIDNAKESVEKLETSVRHGDLVTAKIIEEAEEHSKELGAASSKIKTLAKEIQYYKGFSFFTNLLTNPLFTIKILLQRLEESQQCLRAVLSQARDLIVLSYNKKLEEIASVEASFDKFIEQCLLKEKCLDFDSYEDYESQVQGYKSELSKLQESIQDFSMKKYPQSVALIPKPEDRLKIISANLNRMETALKLINTGALLNSANLNKILEDVNLNNVCEKIAVLKDDLNQEIREKELIAGSPISIQGNLHETCKKILLLLVSLRQLIKRLFEFREKCSSFYFDFAVAYDANPDDYENLINNLKFDLTSASKSFFETPFEESVRRDKTFANIFNRLKEMSDAEKTILEGLPIHFKMVKLNITFFCEEFEPISIPYVYLNMLDKCTESHDKAKLIWDRMSPVYATLMEFRENPNLAPVVKRKIDDFISNQQLILNSIEVCIAFFEAGKVISNKLLSETLTPRIRKERTDILDFINDFEEFMGKLRLKAQRGKGRVTQAFEEFLDVIIKILDEFLEFLRIILERYHSIAHELERARDINSKNLTALIGIASQSLQTLEEDLTNRLQGLDLQLSHKCNMVAAIRGFIEGVTAKEVRVYKKLHSEMQTMQDFIQIVHRDFICVELAQFKYKNLKSVNIENVHKYRLKCANYIQHLENYLQLEEITGRVVIKEQLTRRHALLLELDKIFLLFGRFYEQGRDYLLGMEKLFTKPIDLPSLTKELEEFDLNLSKIAKEVKKNYDAIKNLIIVEEEISVIDLKAIVMDDILEFLLRSQKWVASLLKKMAEMREFDAMIEAQFDGRVLLQREDWLKSIKEFAPVVKDLRIDRKTFQLGYEGIFERMEEFAASLQEKFIKAKESKVSLVKQCVQHINTCFLNERFFTVDRTDPVDKITPKLWTLAENVREMRISDHKMHQKLVRYNIRLADALEAIDFLSDRENLRIAGFKSVERLDIIKKYVEQYGLYQWHEVTTALLEKGTSVVKSIKDLGIWIKTIEASLTGPLFGKQMDLLKGYWHLYHDH